VSDNESVRLNLDDYEAAARARLPRMVYDYYAGGAEDEVTLRANRSAFASIPLRPRVLVDVREIDTSIELLGSRLRTPILLAPTAFQRLAHPDGELASARAATSRGTLMVASTLSTCTVDAIGGACAAPFWFQVYVFRDRAITTELVRRAVAAGATAVCLTVTVPVQGWRERDARNGFRLPSGLEMANFTGLDQANMPAVHTSGLDAFIKQQFDASLTWEAVEWLAAEAGVPVIIKGVMTGEDAARAADHGAAAVIVSNHGGRQLDTAQATVVALPDVVDGAGGRIPVLLDGGIRRGTDVVKAIALGAKAVLIGRPYLWGLATDGQAGVEGVLDLLHEGLRRTMALVGRTSIRELDGSVIGAAAAQSSGTRSVAVNAISSSTAASR
jgi:4-hydroxymandelate oxidase